MGNMNHPFKPKITVFHCINSFSERSVLALRDNSRFELNPVKMACSSMVKEIYLLRAFEAGADAVIVFVCPETQCRHIEGSIWARKRVGMTQKLLDDIGLDGKRLTLVNLRPDDNALAEKSLRSVLADMERIGPNPAT